MNAATRRPSPRPRPRAVWAKRIHAAAFVLRLAILVLLAAVAVGTTPGYSSISFTHGHRSIYVGNLPHDHR